MNDSQVNKAVRDAGCIILDTYRDKLRYLNKLTNCDTGDRIIIVQKLKKDLKRYFRVGKYSASLWYYGQPKEENEQKDEQIKLTCNKCLLQGHTINDCVNDWVCNYCKAEGHKQNDCPEYANDDTDSQCVDDEGVDGTENEVENDDVNQDKQLATTNTETNRKQQVTQPDPGPHHRSFATPRRSRSRTLSRKRSDRAPRTIDANALDQLMVNARNKNETPNRQNNTKNSRKLASPLDSNLPPKRRDKEKVQTSRATN